MKEVTGSYQLGHVSLSSLENYWPKGVASRLRLSTRRAFFKAAFQKRHADGGN
jgi:hypothetical protein